MKAKFFIYSGILFILLAVGLTTYNIYLDIHASNTSKVVAEQISQEMKEESEWKDVYEDVPVLEMPTVEINGHLYVGTLNIPKLDLSLPVMSISNSRNLTISPCRYYGSVYTDDMVIAAHNYRSHFARLNQLNEGDEISFMDVDGNAFVYEVAGLEVLQPDQVEEMIHSDWDLSLYTCTYGGSTRLTIRCVRVEG